MAAIMPKSRRNPRRKGPDPYSNSYVEDGARRYRVCRFNGRPIIVGLRSKKASGGLERAIDIDGRRARQIIRLDDEARASG